MFRTLKPQYLNKLPESEVRYFPTPNSFHASKIERFGDDGIKTPAQVRGKFPMPILALVGDFTIEPCQFSDSTPPIVRAFNFTRKAFVECSELIQGLFKGCGC